MDEMAELARFRGSLPDDPGARARARSQLLRRALGPRPRSRTTLLTRRRLAVVTAAAVVAAAGVVTVDTLVLGERPVGASAAAAAVLRQAADRTIGIADPEVGSRDYLRVTTVWVTSAGVALSSDGDQAQWLQTYTEELFIPGDPAGEWVLRRSPRTPLRPEDAQVQDRHNIPEIGGFTERARDGGFFGGSPQQTASWQAPTAEFLAGLPRDPRQLLDRIRDDAGDAGPSRDGEAVVVIADVLRSGIVPGDLRAALFRTAALIPGVELVDEQANLDGRVGVAVGRYEPRTGERQEIIFDPDTGMLIGERQVLVDHGRGPHLPAGTAIAWTAVTTDIVPADEVDQIPADPRDD